MRRTASLVMSLALLAPGIARTQDVPESSPQAITHYARGIDAYVHDKYDEAIGHFAMAYDLDPTFHVAHLMAAIAAGNAGQAARADSLSALVVPHRAQLSPYYQYRLDAHLAGRRGDLEGMLAANRKAAALGPGTKAAYNVAQVAVQRGLATEALASLRSLDPDREPMKGWRSYYAIYMTAAHMAGAHEDELKMARRGRVVFPGDVRAAGSEVNALAALGRGAEAEAVLAEVTKMPTAGATTAGDVIAAAAQELAIHGNAAASKRWLERGLAWYDSLPADRAKLAASRGDRAYTLYLLGRYAPASAIYDSLAAENPTSAPWAAWSGYLAALRGNRTRATDVAGKIESGEIRFTPPSALLWRGMIAAGLNDRATASTLLRQTGLHIAPMHRDPVVVRVLAADPQWVAYLRGDVTK